MLEANDTELLENRLAAVNRSVFLGYYEMMQWARKRKKKRGKEIYFKLRKVMEEIWKFECK